MVETLSTAEVVEVQELESAAKQEILEQVVRQAEEGFTETQREQLLELLMQYRAMGCTDVVTHQISTGTSPPIRHPVR